MYVVKRDGTHEPVQFDKIANRVRKLCGGLDTAHCDPMAVARRVCSGVYRGVTTAKLDELAIETAASLVPTHPDYSSLAARLAVSCLHKSLEGITFSQLVRRMRAYGNPRTGEAASLVSEELYQVVLENAELLDREVAYERDYSYDYFGFKTLEHAYLLRMDGRVSERPQDMLMRVSLGIHGRDTASAVRTYHDMSLGLYTHASPTLFNAGTPHQQMSSCFLVHTKADSIEGIYDTVKECASISKSAGGVGVSVHDVRASGSYIRGTNGTSNGLVPMCKVYNDTARYVDQGGGKRKGALALYLEPWHADIFGFLDLRYNTGPEELRARDIFTALWVSDLFMRRVREEGGTWTLFCPNEAPGLSDAWGAEFEELYQRYEREGRGRRTVRALDLWRAILEAQLETGTPYMLFKDACNRKSNHQHLGTIKCSNLCTEVVQYTSPEETAVCNLASLALPRFVVGGASPGRAFGSADCGSRSFDFEGLAAATRRVVANLNLVIDRNHYPVPPARRSNLRHRPVGVGVQGLADVFLLLGLPFESEGAARLNRRIFETLYYAALDESCRLAAEQGPYETYPGSPASSGVLQFDMWGVVPDSGLWDWAALRERIARHGLRNSLLVAPMPTASTSQVLGNNEAFEPYTSNIYVRRALCGDFTVVNRHLVADLIREGLWTDEVRNEIVAANGSVQHIEGVPDRLKALYKTVWEMRQKTLVDMAADRGAYVDQSQSFNIHMEAPSLKKLTSAHFYTWEKGLKTGMYYLRTRAATDATKVTVDKSSLQGAAAARKKKHQQQQHQLEREREELEAAPAACSLQDRGSCEACGA